MKVILLYIISILFSYLAMGQESQIPMAYKAIKEISGDLNGDGSPEKVIVYNMTDTEDVTNGTNREIIIFKKQEEHWLIWHRSTKAIGNSKDGGMMGDPFQDIEISNGTLIISSFGGSSWKWNNIDKYRFQDNSFVLVGFISHFGKLCEYWEDMDYNISTGNIKYKKEYENCDTETQIIYKRENEIFTHKLKEIITLENRKQSSIKIITPKYKHELYL